MNTSASLLCGATARWLAAVGTVAGALGGGAALGAAALWLLKAPWAGCAVVALLLVLPERLLALRTRFDAGLFAELAARLDTSPGDAGTHTEQVLASLDDALAALGLRPPSVGTRGLAERVQGARRLAMQHIAVGLVQAGAVLAQLMATAWADGSLR